MRFLTRLRPRHGAAIGAGLLLALSFPKADVAGLAWVAPGLLLFSALGQTGKSCFRIGYLAGLTQYLVSLNWLLFIPFPAGAIVGWLALSAYLALYPALWVWLCWRIFARTGTTAEHAPRPGPERSIREAVRHKPPAQAVASADPQVGGSDPASSAIDRVRAGFLSGAHSWWAAVGGFFDTPWGQRAGFTVVCAALWVGLEMLVARLWSGFPWALLGVSQYRMVPLIQVASVTGVYGVSFLVIWFSLSLTVALLRVLRQPELRWGWLLELRLVLVALMGVFAFGVGRLLERPEAGRELTVALVQPSIPQLLIWDHSEDANRFSRILELSELALAAKPDLLIWPESSMPALTDENFQAITNLVRRHKVWMILGADDAEPHHDPVAGGEYDFFNAAFLIDPAGRLVATYHKQHLVMFGEYLPFARQFPWLRRIIPIPGDFAAGNRPVGFELEQPKARLAPLICFEDVVPGLARRSAAGDIDALLNLTNDGWFGQSAAQWQQAANAVFRAVENGLPLVRCTNNGLTCWIDSRGRLRQFLGAESGDIYAPGFLLAKIPLPAPGQTPAPTFYHQHGDWFGWACVALSIAACAVRGIWGRRQRNH